MRRRVALIQSRSNWSNEKIPFNGIWIFHLLFPLTVFFLSPYLSFFNALVYSSVTHSSFCHLSVTVGLSVCLFVSLHALCRFLCMDGKGWFGGAGVEIGNYI